MESAEARHQQGNITTSSTLEQWCEETFSRLVNQNHIRNIALFIWVDSSLKLAASQTQDVFSFYPTFKPSEEYSGYHIDWEELASKHSKNFSFISELPFNGGWQQKDLLWEHAVIALSRNHECLGYLLVEAETDGTEKRLSAADFAWLEKEADLHLQSKVLTHRLHRQSYYNRQSELDLALNNHTLESQLAYLKNLHEISLRFTKATSIHSLCRIAVELGRDSLRVDRIAIFLCDMEKQKMWGTWGTDPNGNVVDRSEFCQDMPNTDFMAEALNRKNEMLVKENVPLYFGKEQVGIGWNIMMAMWNGDECIGWLAADNLLYRTPLDDPKKEAIKLLAASVCQKIVKLRETEAATTRMEDLVAVNHRYAEELNALKKKLFEKEQNERWMNVRDEKTGLPNGQAFANALPGIIKQARKEKLRVAAVAIEIDDFRGYRRVFGDNAATNLAKRIAADIENHIITLLPSMLTYSSAGRFSLLMLHDDDLMLRDIAETLVKSVYQLNIPNNTSANYHRVTLSIGVTLDSVSLFTQQSKIMKRAEKLRSTASQLGQNRVCMD